MCILYLTGRGGCKDGWLFEWASACRVHLSVRCKCITNYKYIGVILSIEVASSAFRNVL